MTSRPQQALKISKRMQNWKSIQRQCEKRPGAVESLIPRTPILLTVLWPCSLCSFCLSLTVCVLLAALTSSSRTS